MLQTTAALAKLCALCEQTEDAVELTEFTEVLKLLEFQESVDKKVLSVSFCLIFCYLRAMFRK